MLLSFLIRNTPSRIDLSKYKPMVEMFKNKQNGSLFSGFRFAYTTARFDELLHYSWNLAPSPAYHA
jgi:hypothetical protein